MLALDLAWIVNYNSFIVLATVITIQNYNCKIIIAQSKGDSSELLMKNHNNHCLQFYISASPFRLYTFT
jgi:hypothetical protein